MPGRALVTVRGAGGPPTLQEAARQLGVAVDAVDAEFGVVLVDPRQGLYSVRVDADRLLTDPAAESYRGPFSNPRIEPLGPPGAGPRA